MKIFSAFDSTYKYREFAYAKSKFGEEKVLLINKSRTHYYTRFLMPIILLISMRIWAMTLIPFYFSTTPVERITFTTTVCIWWILFIIYKSYINHILVFIIVTPEEVNIYNQLGLTHRNIKSVLVKNISWVYVDRNWLLNSIMNNGNITIENSENSHTKVYFGPVSHPDRTKKKIENIIDKPHVEGK
jgi:hypothetical protein